MKSSRISAAEFFFIFQNKIFLGRADNIYTNYNIYLYKWQYSNVKTLQIKLEKNNLTIQLFHAIVFL